jgi:hypothetical protein
MESANWNPVYRARREPRSLIRAPAELILF